MKFKIGESSQFIVPGVIDLACDHISKGKPVSTRLFYSTGPRVLGNFIIENDLIIPASLRAEARPTKGVIYSMPRNCLLSNGDRVKLSLTGEVVRPNLLRRLWISLAGQNVVTFLPYNYSEGIWGEKCNRCPLAYTGGCSESVSFNNTQHLQNTYIYMY